MIEKQLGVADAADEGLLAIKRFQLAPGLKINLFAAEPFLANPVSFSSDEKGRWHVAETFRVYTGVPDVSEHLGWVAEDLASQTVEERLALLQRKYGDHFDELTTFSEKVVRIEDRDGDGDGVADSSIVFAEDFDTPLDGIGAGVLARGDDVWFANIPNLWRLRDTNHSSRADVKDSLHYGYGVRVAALRVFAKNDSPDLASAVRAATASDSPQLRSEGLKQLSRLSPDDAVQGATTTLKAGAIPEQQASFAVLGELSNAAGDRLLAAWLDKLVAGDVAAELQLDLLEAAARRTTPSIQEKLK